MEGCADPPPIAEGRVTVGEAGRARLECEAGHVLAGSLQSGQDLVCNNSSRRWQPPVQHCVSTQVQCVLLRTALTRGSQFLLQYGNSSVVARLTAGLALRLQRGDTGWVPARPGQCRTLLCRTAGWGLEVVATILVGALLLLSAGVALLVLYRVTRAHHQLAGKVE